MTVLPAEVDRPTAGGAVEVALRRKCRVRPSVVVPTRTDDPTVFGQAGGPRLDAGKSLLQAGQPGEIDRQLPVGQAFQVDVSVDQAGKRATAKADDLGAAARRRASLRPDRKDPAVRAGGHLWLTTHEERCSAGHRP